MTVNAGAVPTNHWTKDPRVGGGRIVGEACHFIDLLRFLAGSPVVEQNASSMRAASRDTATISLSFADGSMGTVHYLANGSRAFPKERLEVFTAGKVVLIDNFRRLRAFGWPSVRSMRLWRQDKGQAAFVAAFLQAVQGGGPWPIPLEELVEVARIALAAQAAVEGVS
jgi:predicted dehydrogenase